MPVYRGSTVIYSGAGGGGVEALNTPDMPVYQTSNVTVTAAGTAHTKGAWTELVASTAGACDVLQMRVGVGASGVDTATLIDVAVGAAGSEVAIVSNVAIGSGSGLDVLLPVSVPSGSRLSARIQSVVASKTALVLTQGYIFGVATPTSLVTLGTSTATSRGTGLVSADTYAQVVASTSQDFAYLVAVPSASKTAMIGATGLVTVAKGASGSEVVLSRFLAATVASELISVASHSNTVLTDPVPSGTRLAFKADDNRLDITLLGVPPA